MSFDPPPTPGRTNSGRRPECLPGLGSSSEIRKGRVRGILAVRARTLPFVVDCCVELLKAAAAAPPLVGIGDVHADSPIDLLRIAGEGHFDIDLTLENDEIAPVALLAEPDECRFCLIPVALRVLDL
jgi:hypothetical protein